mgnify:FL=1
MLNSGAVLQHRTLPYLKMPSGQCQHLKLIFTADREVGGIFMQLNLCILHFT